MKTSKQLSKKINYHLTRTGLVVLLFCAIFFFLHQLNEHLPIGKRFYASANWFYCLEKGDGINQKPTNEEMLKCLFRQV